MAEQVPFDLGHKNAFSRDDFFVSASNADAVAWVDKWPAWPAPLLVIYGPAGCGKTHLLRIWQQKTGAVDFTAAPDAPKNVVIDDISSMIGNPGREEALFHLYNTLKETGGFALATSDTPPSSWRFTLRDLGSRVLAAPAVAVGSPDDQLMAVVMTKLFSDRQIFVSQDVVQYILPRIERSFAAVGQLVAALDRKGLSEKRAVTIPLVRDFLSAQGDFFRSA